MKARTIEQLLQEFRKEAPELQPTHYELVKKYLLMARNDVTLEKAEIRLKQEVNRNQSAL